MRRSRGEWLLWMLIIYVLALDLYDWSRRRLSRSLRGVDMPLPTKKLFWLLAAALIKIVDAWRWLKRKFKKG